MVKFSQLWFSTFNHSDNNQATFPLGRPKYLFHCIKIMEIEKDHLRVEELNDYYFVS